jgi:hypothetical protein
MNLLKSMLLLSVLVNGALLVSNANAKDPHISYTYVDVGYVYTEFDDIVSGVDADGDGWGVRASAAIHPNVYLFGGYTDQTFDLDISGAPDIDGTSWDLGVGYNYSINEKTSLFARAAYVDAEAESSGISEDDNGYGLGAGVRYMLVTDGIRASVLDGIEFQGGIDYVDLDLGDDTSLSAGVLFHVNSFLGIGLEGSWGDDEASYVAGLRFTLD